MRKLLGVLLLAILGGGSWLLKDKLPVDLNPIGSPSSSGDVAVGDVPARAGDTIRIASFNIQVFGESKLGKPHVMPILADVARKFDVIAIQEIRAKSEHILPTFLDQINAEGRRYDFVIGPRLGRTVSKEQYAFIFDTETVEVDRRALYTVLDRDDLLHREPLVGCFRARGVPSHEAFTFSLVNIHTDPDETDTELDALADVYRAVQHDGRGEDDILLLGDLNVDDRHFGRLGELPGISWAISGVPTNTRRNKLYDNIVYTLPASNEFTGRAGVLDLMGDYGLTMEQALEVSDHLPIWAEFSVYEGGAPGRIAGAPPAAVR